MVEVLQFVLVALGVLLEEVHRAVGAALGQLLQAGAVRVAQLPRARQPALQNFPVRDGVLLAARTPSAAAAPSSSSSAAAALLALLVERFGDKRGQLFHGEGEGEASLIHNEILAGPCGWVALAPAQPAGRLLCPSDSEGCWGAGASVSVCVRECVRARVF